MKRKWLTSIAVLYGGLIAYASLMPFDFASGDHIARQLQGLWSAWPINPSARISGSDVVSNLALYVPLGCLAAARLRLGHAGAAGSFLFSATACSLLSAAAEFAQLHTLSRTASGADWFLNTVSGAVGAIVGTRYGRILWIEGVQWIRRRWAQRQADLAAMTLAGLLAADALAPYLPTIQLSQVWRNLKRSQFSLITGLAVQPWHHWLVIRGLPYAALTTLLAGWGRRSAEPRRWGWAGGVVALLALTLELTKPMIVSRSFNMANLASTWVACLLALLAGPALAEKIANRQKLDLSIVAIVVYVAYLAWQPFNFGFDSGRIEQKMPSLIEMLPLYHYAMGGKLDHIRLFSQNIVLQSLLVYLFLIRFKRGPVGRGGILWAALATGTFGTLLEAGQFFLPSRTPAMTDVYCFALGGALGACLHRRASLEAPGLPAGSGMGVTP